MRYQGCLIATRKLRLWQDFVVVVAVMSAKYALYISVHQVTSASIFSFTLKHLDERLYSLKKSWKQMESQELGDTNKMEVRDI